MSPRHIPNLISVARVFLVYPVIQSIVDGDFRLALALFTVAGLSDGLDGFLARRNGWQSRLGSFLDPVADKVLLVCSYAALAWLDRIPVWLAGLVVLRDLVIFLGASACYFLLRPFEGQPSRLSKLNTFCQLALVIAILLESVTAALPRALTGLLVTAVTLTTTASGLFYVVEWWRKFRREYRRRA